jgi:DNA-binding MarR family transcriptional regulator
VLKSAAAGAILNALMRADAHREIARLLAQLRRYCAIAVNKQLSVVGSTLHEYIVLLRLSEEQEAPQSELAYDAAIDPAAVSRLVRDMMKEGLVTTHVDPKDKRQRFVRLTAKGQIKVRTLLPIVDSTMEPYMAGLNAQEEQQLLRLLRKAYANVSQVAEREAATLTASVRPKARPKKSSVA